jgi:hypothetical protein
MFPGLVVDDSGRKGRPAFADIGKNKKVKRKK